VIYGFKRRGQLRGREEERRRSLRVRSQAKRKEGSREKTIKMKIKTRAWHGAWAFREPEPGLFAFLD
jgi:hypothetical protein